jgi:hypothetical protein
MRFEDALLRTDLSGSELSASSRTERGMRGPPSIYVLPPVTREFGGILYLTAIFVFSLVSLVCVMTAGFCESSVCFIIILGLFITKWGRLSLSVLIRSCA